MNSTVTLIRPDNSVIVNGVGRLVDCSSLPSYVKAIQWTGASGWIEFVQDGSGRFLPNTPLADFAPYSYLVEKWTEAGEKEKPKSVAAAAPEPRALSARRKGAK